MTPKQEIIRAVVIATARVVVELKGVEWMQKNHEKFGDLLSERMTVDFTKDLKHGDYQTNVAMILPGILKEIG
jgi:hypothetical protein